jgi:hypothetical protein
VGRSTVLLEKAVQVLVPCQLVIKFVQYSQVSIGVDCAAKENGPTMRWLDMAHQTPTL